MIIDKLKFNHLILNINSLNDLHPLITQNCELQESMNHLQNIYCMISGSLMFSDDITNDVMNTEILSVIGKIKNQLLAIRETELRNINSSNSKLISAIKHILDSDPCDVEYEESQTCKCGGNFIYDKKFIRCDRCDAVRYNDLDNYNIDMNSSEILNRNNNIIKHLHKNLMHVYGESWPDKLPVEVSDMICAEIKRKLPYLEERVHYSYEVHEVLHNMKFFRHEGILYKPKNYKIFTNSFIVKTYPNLTINKLEVNDYELLYSSFLNITAEFLNIITQKTSGKTIKYNNNYLYTIHRILFMKLRQKSYIKDLLRFIYIQSPSSFAKKDKKLRKVNDKINCFTRFFDTPTDIYINNKYY